MALSSESKLWYLSQINLFAAMQAEEMKQMEAMTSMCSTPKYDPIYLPGDPADSIYLLKKGRVRTSRLSLEGKQITLSILEPGDIFGELSLLEENAEQESIAEAMEDTLLCIVRKQDFERFLNMHPSLNLKITKLIGLRLRQITNQMESLVFKSAEQRLKDLLIRLSQEYPKTVADGYLINLKLTHQDLGELTNISRQTVTELLKKLEVHSFIRFEKRRIVVLKHDIQNSTQTGGA